jgi:hypothetical protein
MRIDVRSYVHVYDVDGTATPMVGDGRVRVEVVSHWNDDKMVVLRVGGKSYLVSADNLTVAIANATNASR